VTPQPIKNIDRKKNKKKQIFFGGFEVFGILFFFLVQFLCSCSQDVVQQQAHARASSHGVEHLLARIEALFEFMQCVEGRI
jgi:hypothetical protein